MREKTWHRSDKSYCHGQKNRNWVIFRYLHLTHKKQTKKTISYYIHNLYTHITRTNYSKSIRGYKQTKAPSPDSKYILENPPHGVQSGRKFQIWLFFLNKVVIFLNSLNILQQMTNKKSIVSIHPKLKIFLENFCWPFT